MKQLPKEYLVTSVNVISDTPAKDLAGRNATKQIIEVVSYQDGTGSQKVTTYNVGVLTGLIGENGSDYYVQFLYDGKLYWTSENGLQLGSVSTAYNAKALSAAQMMLQYDQQVTEDLLLASEFVARLEKKGYNCDKYRNEIKALYNRNRRRTEEIERYCTIDQFQQPNLVSDALSKIMNGERIGVIATSTVIIISVSITAIFSALAWYVYYTYGAEARSDCRKSKELNKILANVDPKVKEEIYNYIDTYADNFYKKAVARTKASNLFGNIKSIALIAGGLFVGYKLFNNKD